MGAVRPPVRAQAAGRGARGADRAAAHAGRAGPAAPGPPRRQRAGGRARALARDRPEAARRRARVRRRADRPLARARPLAPRRALPLRPARLGAGPRPGARPRLDDRANHRLGVRRGGPPDARGDGALAARSPLMLRAVLFDVDFTIARPGAGARPRGLPTARAALRPGARPFALRRRARAGGRGDQAPPGARARRGDLGRLHRADHPRHGRRRRHAPTTARSR